MRRLARSCTAAKVSPARPASGEVGDDCRAGAGKEGWRGDTAGRCDAAIPVLAPARPGPGASSTERTSGAWASGCALPGWRLAPPSTGASPASEDGLRMASSRTRPASTKGSEAALGPCSLSPGGDTAMRSTGAPPLNSRLRSVSRTAYPSAAAGLLRDVSRAAPDEPEECARSREAGATPVSASWPAPWLDSDGDSGALCCPVG